MISHITLDEWYNGPLHHNIEVKAILNSMFYNNSLSNLYNQNIRF